MNKQQIKKCLDCVNSKAVPKDNDFIYECTLSKKKCSNCKRGIKDYYKPI